MLDSAPTRDNRSFRSYATFFGISARLRRRVLIDHARWRGYRKRGGDAQRVPLNEGLIASAEPVLDLLALEEVR